MKKLFMMTGAAMLVAHATTATYNDLGSSSGTQNDYWDTTSRAALEVSTCASSNAVPLDGLFKTLAESAPASFLSTVMGLLMIIR